MPPAQKRVLIVEDDSAFASVVRFALQRAGFAVCVAPDGNTAWDILQTQYFELMITDQRLPGITGTELCRRMRQNERLAKMPIVMLTCAALELKESWLWDELRVSAVLSKPFSPRQLVRLLRAAFESSESVGDYLAVPSS